MNNFQSAVQVGAEWVTVDILQGAFAYADWRTGTEAQLVANEKRVAAVVRDALVRLGDGVVRVTVWAELRQGVVADVFGADEEYLGRLKLVAGPWDDSFELYHRAGRNGRAVWNEELAAELLERTGGSLAWFLQVVGSEKVEEWYRTAYSADRILDKAINLLGYEPFLNPVEPVVEPVVVEAEAPVDYVVPAEWSVEDEELWQEELGGEESSEDDDFPGGEYARGIANESAEQYRLIAIQNAEDEAADARRESYYHGVRGSWNPEDGWIYEP